MMNSERHCIITELRRQRTKLLLQKNEPLVTKNSAIAEKYNDLGYRELDDFKNAKISKVAYVYNQSIAYAEENSKIMANAYTGRSRFLFFLKKYEECFPDIDRALSFKVPNGDRMRFMFQKIIYLAEMGDTKYLDVFKQCRNIAQKRRGGTRLFDETFIMHKKYVDNMFEVSRELKRLAGMYNAFCDTEIVVEVPQYKKAFLKKVNQDPTASVSIKWSKEFGKHLVAKQDYAAGKILFVENPCVKSIDLQSFYFSCGHCLKASLGNIPCKYCNWCMFCSEQCRKEAWEKYHDIECTIMSRLIIEMKKKGKRVHNYQFLTVRLLIIATREAGGIYNLKKKLLAIDKCLETNLKEFDYQLLGPSGTAYILNDTLVNNQDVQNSIDPFIKTSVFILISLLKYTSFFGNRSDTPSINELLKNENVLFIGSLILKLSKISYNNCEISDGGCYLAPFSSLMNHSCFPNVACIVTEKLKLIFYSLEPIKKHSQIFTCYTYTYFEKPKSERHPQLKSLFNFVCDCAPCKFDWPPISEVKNIAVKEFHRRIGTSQRREEEIEKRLKIIESRNILNANETTVKKICQELNRNYVFMKTNPATDAVYKLRSGLQKVFEFWYKDLD